MRHSLELGAVGALLKNNSFLDESGLTATDFTSPIAETMWDIAEKEIAQGKAIDAFSMIELLPENLVQFIGQCTEHAWSYSLAKTHATQIKSHKRKDEVKRLGAILCNEPERLDEVLGELSQLDKQALTYDKHIKDVLKESIVYIDKVVKGEISSITTGLKSLDNALGGFHESDLVVIAARPSMGKTALILNSMLRCNARAGFFSAEMGSVQVGSRITAIDSKVSGQLIRQGRLTENHFNKLVGSFNKLKELPIWVDSTPSPTVRHIASQARKWKSENQIEILYIDYLGRLNMPGNAPKRERIGEAVKALKTLAVQLDIPVVLVAQLSRQADGVRPSMSHLADSADI
jgi:replicative DNA helicase